MSIPAAPVIGRGRALGGCIQAVGTWGSATLTLQKSANGTDWVDVKDLDGTTIAMTADGMAEFTTAAPYLRLTISGGTGDDINVWVSVAG